MPDEIQEDVAEPTPDTKFARECASCAYFANRDGSTCHRFPPPWPLVKPEQWCGEWTESPHVG